jgi:hypothetical protein
MRSTPPPRYSFTPGTHARKQKDVPASHFPDLEKPVLLREARRSCNGRPGSV